MSQFKRSITNGSRGTVEHGRSMEFVVLCHQHTNTRRTQRIETTTVKNGLKQQPIGREYPICNVVDCCANVRPPNACPGRVKKTIVLAATRRSFGFDGLYMEHEDSYSLCAALHGYNYTNKGG